jgi:hypothetical protein
MMRVDALEGEALAGVVQSTRTSPLVADWYEGTLPYLGRLLCFLNFNKLSCARLLQAGFFAGTGIISTATSTCLFLECTGNERSSLLGLGGPVMMS